MSRVYIGNLDPRVTERDLEDEFRIFGVLRNVWVARRPPGYAFIEFDDRRDALDAIRELDGKNGWRVELSHNSKGGGGRGGRRGVVNLVTLLVNAAHVVHGAWGMVDVEAPVLVAVGVQAMDMGVGATVHMGKDLLDPVAYHLAVVAASAGHLHIVVLVVIHLMLMEIKVGTELSKSGIYLWKRLCNTVVLGVSVRKGVYVMFVSRQ